MDAIQQLEDEQTLLEFRRRQLQLDLDREEFEIKKRLAQLKKSAKPQAVVHTADAEAASNKAGSATERQREREHHVFIDLTIEEGESIIKGELENEEGIQTLSKTTLSPERTVNEQAPKTAQQEDRCAERKTSPSGKSTFEKALTTQKESDIDETPPVNGERVSDQEDGHLVVQESSSTARSQISAGIPMDRASSAGSKAPANSRKEKAVENEAGVQSLTPVCPTVEQPVKRKKSQKPVNKRKANKISQNPELPKPVRDEEEHPVGVGSREAARLRQTLPKNNRLSGGFHVPVMNALKTVELEYNAVLAAFQGNFLLDLVSNNWSLKDLGEIKGVWGQIEPSVKLKEFESMKDFAREVTEAAKSTSFCVRIGIKQTLDFFQSEWELCWEECRGKESQAERLQVARTWIDQLDRDMGVGR